MISRYTEVALSMAKAHRLKLAGNYTAALAEIRPHLGRYSQHCELKALYKALVNIVIKER